MYTWQILGGTERELMYVISLIVIRYYIIFTILYCYRKYRDIPYSNGYRVNYIR